MCADIVAVSAVSGKVMFVGADVCALIAVSAFVVAVSVVAVVVV